MSQQTQDVMREMDHAAQTLTTTIQACAKPINEKIFAGSHLSYKEIITTSQHKINNQKTNTRQLKASKEELDNY